MQDACAQCPHSSRHAPTRLCSPRDVLVELLDPMEDIPISQSPPALTFGDSAVIALRACQTVLQRRHFDPFPQPGHIRALTRILNTLPVSMRIRIADFVGVSVSRSADEFRKIDPDAVASWVIKGYTADRYPGVILGAPGLAVTFLSGLTGFPYLPQPLLFNARRDMHPDDSQAYLDAGREIAEPLLEKHKSIEAIIHFDPVHDRFLIRRVVFVRTRYLELPRAYRRFIEERLTPGSPVILLDCRFRWLMAEISDRLYFQLGGLGGVAPEEYLDETEPLKAYRNLWGASEDAKWRLDRDFVSRPESEWGTTGDFIDEAGEIASKSGHKPIRVIHAHPGELSRRVFSMYRRTWQGDSPPRDAYIGVFTHTEPRFPLVTGSMPIWLPFITDDNIPLAEEILECRRQKSGTMEPEGAAYVTLHPSFCAPPDMVQLSTWRDLLSRHFAEVRFLGINQGRYPYDLGSYVAMYPALTSAAAKAEYPGTPFRRPTFAELQEFLAGNA